MLLSYLLLIGGAAMAALGYAASATVITAVGGTWLVVSIVFWSLARRRRAAAIGPEDMANPAARARIRQVAGRGPAVRGLITLALAGGAVTTGILRLIERLLPDAAAIVPIIAGFLVGLLALMGLLMYAFSGAERSAVYPATVVILGYKDTTLSNGQQPYVRFVLDVYPQGLPRYEATVQTPVPALAVPKLAVGARFSAQVAGPGKPNTVLIDWSSATAGPAAPGQPAGPGGPPPPAPRPAAPADPAARLRELDTLHAQGLVTDTEYQAQRTRILDSL